MIETRLKEVFPSGDVELPDKSRYLTEDVDCVLDTFLEEMLSFDDIRFDWCSPFASDRVRRLVFVPKEAPPLRTWWFDDLYEKIRWLEEHGGVYRAAFVDVSLVIPVVRTRMHAWRVDWKTGRIAPACEPGPHASPWREFLAAVVARCEGLGIAEMPHWFSTTPIPYVRILDKDRPEFSSEAEMVAALPELVAQKLGISSDLVQGKTLVETCGPTVQSGCRESVEGAESPGSKPAVLEECLFWY